MVKLRATGIVGIIYVVRRDAMGLILPLFQNKQWKNRDKIIDYLLLKNN